MMIKRLNHLAIETVKFEKTLDFYINKLGFLEKETIIQDGLRTTFVEIENVCRIEVIERGISEQLSERKTGHIAFDVEDVKISEQKLIQAGVDIKKPCTDLTIFNTRLIQILDPNNNIIALRQNII